VEKCVGTSKSDNRKELDANFLKGFELSLRSLGRIIKMELLSEEDDIVKNFFTCDCSQKACRLLLNELKAKRGLTRTEFSNFGWALDKGTLKQAPGFTYSRPQFYAQIRKTLLVLGLMGIAQRPMEIESSLVPSHQRRRDIVEKYIPILQPITKRPPDGLNIPRICWMICQKWNEEFEESNG
jgi:hypothetical protein